MPRHLLYSIFARIGGSGLDTDAFETCALRIGAGFLGKAIAYDNRQKEIPSLAHLFAPLASGAADFFSRSTLLLRREKEISRLDRVASSGDRAYDLFHSWSGDCLQSLRVARKRGIPSIVEIPDLASRPRQESIGRYRRLRRNRSWKEKLLLARDRFIEEYELADLLVVLSEKAADTFRVQGFPESKLYYLPRGVDVERFKPGVRPPMFRAVFSGALIERKGIHHLLEAWHRLDLKDAELWLIGISAR